jgi:small subunit ribosomal protein S6
MRVYEVMLILPAEADDALITSTTDRIAQVVKDGGGITSVDSWGRRRMTYELDGHGEGFYVVVQFTADPSAIRELDRVLSLADEVIRFKIVVREAPPSAQASADTTATASTPASTPA